MRLIKLLAIQLVMEMLTKLHRLSCHGSVLSNHGIHVCDIIQLSLQVSYLAYHKWLLDSATSYCMFEDSLIHMCLNLVRREVVALFQAFSNHLDMAYIHRNPYPFSEQETWQDSIDADLWSLRFCETFHEVQTYGSYIEYVQVNTVDHHHLPAALETEYAILLPDGVTA